MAEAIGAAASIVGLISTALTLVDQVQRARNCVKGRPRIMKAVAKQLQSVSQSLTLVKEERRLQTPCVEQQINDVIEVAEELKEYFQELQLRQKRDPIIAFFHALKVEKGEDKELDSILVRLDRTKDDLIMGICVTHVGLVGNMEDGFRVVHNVLEETNNHVKDLVERDLTLMDCVRGRPTEDDGTVLLDNNDAQALNLHDRKELMHRTPGYAIHLNGQTGNIEVNGAANGLNTGISSKRGVNTEPSNSIPSIMISGRTGNIKTGGEGQGLNTGICI